MAEPTGAAACFACGPRRSGLSRGRFFKFDFAADDRFEPVITPTAVAAGVAAAIGTGGLLGTLPVFHVLATPIAEAIRG